MSKKQFIKRTLVAVCITVSLVIIASLTYAYVIPALLTADIPGIIAGDIGEADEMMDSIGTVLATTTNELQKTHKNTQTLDDTPKNVQYNNARQTIPEEISYGAVRSGTVTKIVDGDTLDIDGIRIRLALVNTPERDESGYVNATAFTRNHCPVGTIALYDADDGQKDDSHGRKIAKVWCMGYPAHTPTASLNSLLVSDGHAEILYRFCNESEFGDESWAKQSGC